MGYYTRRLASKKMTSRVVSAKSYMLETPTLSNVQCIYQAASIKLQQLGIQLAEYSASENSWSVKVLLFTVYTPAK